MKYGSICSGVEAATLAWSFLGWKAVFFAEIEPFPSAVLCHRFKATRPLRPLDPAVADNEKERKTRELWRRQIAGLPEDGTIPNYGDFTLIKKEDVNEDIDLLVGGTPCQDLSIAGKRLGFEGQRSVLALDFVRLCFELGVRWVVWENVPYENITIRDVMESNDYVNMLFFYAQKTKCTLHNFSYTLNDSSHVSRLSEMTSFFISGISMPQLAASMHSARCSGVSVA